MATETAKRCGTCELLERSSTPGLATYGKCPHRASWVRAHDAACAHHQGEPRGPLVRIALAVNLAVAGAGAAVAIALDVRHGTPLTHALLAAGALVVAAFAWLVRREGVAGEDAKWVLLDEEEPPEPPRR